jgi:hypothetical protein
MTPELKEKWIKALRSGEYTQGRGALRSTTKNGTCYCCLGVLADIVDHDAWRDDQPWNGKTLSIWKNEQDATLEKSCEEVGLSMSEQNLLMHLNDSRSYTFDEIGDFIEFGMAQ